MLFKNVAARSVLIVRCHGIPADNLVPDAEKNADTYAGVRVFSVLLPL